MTSLAIEMTADTLAGVTTPSSSQSTSGGGPGGSAVTNNSAIDSTQSSEKETIHNSNQSTTSQNNSNNTISAAADSSDNQPSTPHPVPTTISDALQTSSAVHHSYVSHHIYSSSQPATTAATNTHLNPMYPHHVYSQPNMDLQQQQSQLLQPPITPTQHSAYPSYLNSYEQFYQQQQQQQQNPAQSSGQVQNPQQMDYINANTNTLFTSSEYKQQAGVRYHPYLHAPTSGIPSVNSQNSNSSNALDTNAQTPPVVSSATSSLMSPRIVSSTSPSSSSNQMQISGSASSIGSLSAGNPSSPNSAGSSQCKKCGIMCTNESELQEHITNVHGASPYGSSGYASSPYIKEEMQQPTPPSQNQQQQQSAVAQQTGNSGANPGEILDLDSQKMLYPPAPGSMATMIHQPLSNADPLHGLHNMQQRAGVTTWDPQSQEGLPTYLQQQTESKNLPNHSPYYQSPKQSPYQVTNSTNTNSIIKTEYQPIIKSEFVGDTQQYITDKPFDPTAPSQQQQMMPPAVSSSPAEFPSTTTGGPQDGGQQNVVTNQQFRAGSFEPPSSSSATLPTAPLGAKAANWKSNEARRPKTYNCTACNKWFTSSGHLKRHYNTTLHKNAVKSSGQPDPATLPISAHHHPARDPSGKTGRRSAAAAAAAAANASGANVQQQQQQQPNPVQPPEPPNSPQDYGGSQVAAAGLTPLPHYAATSSPNGIYQQQQQYQQLQYMPQVQSTTNASSQHVSAMVNHHLQQQQQNQQQQTVMNGHPNALAGLSVPPTQQQTPMPSSQMRGLLTTMQSSTATTPVLHTVKNERLEAATMAQQIHLEGAVDELGYLSIVEVKEEYSEEMEGDLEEHNIYSPKGNMELAQEGVSDQQESEVLLQEVDQQASEALREVGHSVKHLPSTSHVPTLNQIPDCQLQQAQQLATERQYHNTTPSRSHSNMPAQSTLIISHQQYQVELQRQQPMVAQDTFTITQAPLPQQLQLQHNIMEHQPYINIPLDISMQQPPNNTLQPQQPFITTEQQPLPPATTIPTTSMVNMLQHSHQHMQPLPSQHTELQPLVSTQLQLDTLSTNIQSHTTTTNSINMPSCCQMQHQGLVLQPLDPTLTYPHTIIGNTDLVALDVLGNVVSPSGRHVLQTSDGQLVQVISGGPKTAAAVYSNSYMLRQRSPQAGDLPPMAQACQQQQLSPANTFTELRPSASCSISLNNSHSNQIECKPLLVEEYLTDCSNEDAQRQQLLNLETIKIENNTSPSSVSSDTTSKRKRNSSSSSSVGAQSTILPNGRIKCLPCDKEFTKICYLTQHNKSFHSGEYPFRCQKCGKRYQSEDVYLIHLDKHKTTDKAHKCDLCPKQFHHKTDLRRHIEAIHTGNKQHSCDVCEKSFCRKDHLRKHLETHNRQRPQTKKTNLKANQHASTNSNNNNSMIFKNNIKSNGAGLEAANDLNLDPLAPVDTGLLPRSSLPPTSSAATSRKNRAISLTDNSTTPPLFIQQVDDVVATADEFIGDEYGGGDMEENHEFLTLEEYEQRIQAQYTVDKYEVYEMVEQQLPIY